MNLLLVPVLVAMLPLVLPLVLVLVLPLVLVCCCRCRCRLELGRTWPSSPATTSRLGGHAGVGAMVRGLTTGGASAAY